MYLQAEITCHKCGQQTYVYTWPCHQMWGEDEPPALDRPPNVVLTYSNTMGYTYWANICIHCGVLQGDWHLYRGPKAVFSEFTDSGGCGEAVVSDMA